MKTPAEQTSTSILPRPHQRGVSVSDRTAISKVLPRRRLRAKGGTLAALRIGVLGFLLGFGETVLASAAVDAASAVMVFPVVAQTASFTSEITVFNPHPDFDLVLNVQYVGGVGTSAAGLRSCGTISLIAKRAAQFDVGLKCSLLAGTQFGMLRISDNGVNGIPVTFHAYSRVANPQGIGFSVPGYPNAVFESAASQVIGLKRQSAAPVYQTNCFIGSRDDPLTLVSIRLLSADNVQIGDTLFRSLAPNEFVRYVDIFSAVGAPAGDYANVRAQFEANTALIAFCTVQDNTSFGADFRIAGVTEPHDLTRQYLTSNGDGAYSFPSSGQKAVFSFLVRAPDKFRCRTVEPEAPHLELRVREFFSGIVLGGGNNVDDTGVISVTSGLLTVEVSVKESGAPVYPIPYGLDCWSGNGHFQQFGLTFLPDDF